MTRMLSPARLLPAAGGALLCVVLALSYASAQDVPAAPTIDSVSPGDVQLTVAWTAPAGETGITAYDVRHIETSADETDDANWIEVDDAGTSGTLEDTITGLTNGTEYDVQVRAVNSHGDGTWSDTKTGTPALPAPTIDSVRADDRAVRVSWSAPTGITTGVAAYDVRYIETSADEMVDANWTVEENAWEDGGGSLAYAVTGLTNGTEYDVQVRAVDEDDVDGAWSATTSATPADHSDTRAAATSVTAGANVWGVIDPADDEDYFSFSLSRTADYWIYTLGDLDTVGELLDSNGMSIDINDRGSVLPNPDNFFLWHRLQSGTYYLKVTGYGSTDEPYILRVREFTDTTSRGNAATLAIDGFASGTIDPKYDADYFKLELSETTEVAIRTSGFLDTLGELYDNDGTEIAYNDDGYLPGGRRNFLIRESLNAGVYYVRVRSYRSSSDGPYTVYATAITEPGRGIDEAQPLTLGGTAGGNIDPAGDEDYFSLTLDEPAYVIIGAARRGRGIDTDGMLLDDSSNPVQGHIFDDHRGFYMQFSLNAGTYYVKVAGNGATDTGRYTIRATEDPRQDPFRDSCSSFPRRADISDPLYGCQWHLNNYDQFSNSAGQDIRVEEVWPTYTGSGINVAVVDGGMHYQHEDLTDNVLTAFNHNYDPGLTDIYHPYENHGTAVAGIIAAKDNSLGMRGVAPGAKIYGYNLLERFNAANTANAMSRNAATTAISNNSWGSFDNGRPGHANELWEIAVKDGVTTGYGGKGVFYAWAAGNGGDRDYATLDEYTSYYAVTAVCAVGHDDIRSRYSEAGANLWVCGPSSSGREGQPRIATTDNGHSYRSSFGGTSAATPIVAGVAALIREADNALTWRDVKLILAASARKVDPDNTGWEQGAFKYGSTTDRYNFNHKYGFGMVDAKAAVDLAETWANVRDLREITAESRVINLAIPDVPSSGMPTTVTTSLTIDPFVEFVEFVEVNAHFNHRFFRDLTVELVAPSGTVSTLSKSALVGGSLTTEFRFGSARHLGEDPAGEWTLRIKDLIRRDTGALRSWGITIYGHGFVPGEPEIDTVTPGVGTLVVNWNAPTDTGETATTSYDLRYIREDATDKSDDNWSEVTGVGTLSNRSYTITGLSAGVKYDIQLRAHNDSGHGPWSLVEADEPTTVAPSAPAITDVTRSDSTLAVVWTAPADTGGGVITAYDVRFIETSEDETVDANWTVRDNAWESGDLQYNVTSLTNATEYDVQVRAVNSAGDGAWSDTETGTPRPDTPITLQWEETSFTVAEDAGSVVLRAIFTTTLNTSPETDFTFDVTLTTTDTGTTQDDDYTAPPSSATFVASDFSETDVNGEQRYRATRDFTVAIFDDTADESNESFRVRLAYLTPGLPHLQGGPATAVVTIQDNDHVPVTLSWEQSDLTVGENTGNATLRAYAITTVGKPPEDGFAFAAAISTSDGSAAQPGDYTQVDDTVSFGQSDFTRTDVGGGQFRFQATRDISVSIIDDTVDEPDEDFTVTLSYSNPSLPHLQGGPATATVTIADNDHVPVTLSWEQSDLTVGENVGSATLRAYAITTVDKPPKDGFAFDAAIFTSDDSATQPGDYTHVDATVTFGQGDFTRTDVGGGQFRFQATRDISVSIIDDTVDEPDEDFTVTLSYSNPSLPHLQGGPATATVTIVDNEHVPVTISWEPDLTVGENVGSATLRAYAITTVDKRPEDGFAFDASIRTSDGSAAQPGDYTQVDDTVTFGQSDFSRVTINSHHRYRAAKEVPVPIQDDTFDEDEEDFTVTIEYANPGPLYLQGGSATMSVKITDNDFVPVTISWDQSPVSVDEDATTVTLQAQATTMSDRMPESGFTVPLSATTADGSATQPDDYTQVDDTVTFDRDDFSRVTINGQFRYQATGDISVSIIDDTVDEPDEDFTVTLSYSNPSLPHLQGGPATATVTIADNEHVPVTISWEPDLTVGENVGSATLRAYAITTVDKRPEDGFAFDASIRTSDGSAAQPGDYTRVDDTVTFGQSDFTRTDVEGGQFRYQATRDISVSIIDDTVDEPDEDFTVTLSYSNPSLPHLQGGPATATVTITDNDHVPVTISWEQSDLTVGENVGSATLRAYATTTSDKMPESGFTVPLSATTADGSATQPDDYTQVDATVTFGQIDFTRTDVGGGQFRYQATRDISVSIIHDTVDEPDEDFTVTLSYSNPSLPHLQGGPATATVTIADNDYVPVTISWDQSPVSVGEDATTVTLQARATTMSDKMPESGFTVPLSATTADGSATQPDDYTQVDATVTFGQIDFTHTDVGGGQFRYQATGDISVSIIDDTVDEPDEDFTVTLSYSNPSLPHLQGGPATATVTIADNDHVPVTLSWEQSDLTVGEDATTVTLQARATTRSDKMPESGFTVALSATTADNTATQGSDYGRLTSSFSFGQGDFTHTDMGGGQFRFQATRDISVSISDDTVDEPDEDFTVILNYSGPSLPHLQGGPATATVTIADNDHVPVVLSWEQAAVTAEEATSPGSTRPVSLSAVAVTTKDKMPESGFTFDVTVATADGSATQPADYQQLSDTATFNRSDFTLTTSGREQRYRAVKTFTVLVTHDTLLEPNETFTVTLNYADPSLPYLQGGRDTATVTITDDISSTVDLSTTVSGSPSSVSRGEELTYDYRISNSGPAASTNTVVRSTLDRGVSFVSVTPADKCAHSGGATGGVVTCTFDTLDAGASEAGEIVVQVGPAASADIAITSIATGGELDRSPADNTAADSTELLTPPEQVTNLSPVRSGIAFIELSWARPSDNGSPITGYELERKEAGESYALVSPGPSVAAITYLDSQVSAGTTYTYQLRAVNAGGVAEWSNEVAAATTRVTPPPPSSSSSSGGGGGGGGGDRRRATPTPTPTPSPTPTATPTPTGPQFSGVIAAEPSVTATVVPEGTTLGLNGGADLPGGVYVNFPPTAVALPVHVSISLSNTAPDDVTAPSGTTLLPLTIDITSDTPLILGEPITIEINPTPEQLAAAGGDLNHLAVGVVTPHGIVVLPTQVMHGRLVVTVDHLSTFTLLAITDPGPVLTQPPMGDASSMGPLLQWTQPPRTTWFQVQVIPFNEDGPGINLVIGDGALVRAAQYQVLGPNFGSADPNYVMLPGMTYLWRVRTSTVLTNPTAADWSAWAVSSFKTPPASSSTITRVAPPFFGEVSTLTPTLTWANSNTAVFYYEVQVSKDYEFGPNAFLYSEYVHGGASTPPNSYVVPAAFPLEAGEIYYWRVRPRIQGDGDPLPWSATYVFLTPG